MFVLLIFEAMRVNFLIFFISLACFDFGVVEIFILFLFLALFLIVIC